MGGAQFCATGGEIEVARRMRWHTTVAMRLEPHLLRTYVTLCTGVYLLLFFWRVYAHGARTLRCAVLPEQVRLDDNIIYDDRGRPNPLL